METDLAFSKAPSRFKAKQLPEVNFSHIINLTNDTGILQQAVSDDQKEKYSIDDNARALFFTVLACKDKKNPTAMRLMGIYLQFIQSMQTSSGEFKKLMNDSKDPGKDMGNEDSFGRTIMALGYTVHKAPTNLLARGGTDIFNKAYKHIENLSSLRGMAYSIIGLCEYVKHNYPDDVKTELIIKLCDKLKAAYEKNQKDDWHWFEDVLSYDNAILPLALLNAYEITQDESYLSIALESIFFLESKVFHTNILRPIGNKASFKYGGKSPEFDQQGVDAMAMVLFYQQAFWVTQEKQYKSRMYHSYRWFLGSNDLSLSLYNPLTGGCADGLHKQGISPNQGAEGSLAYWISHLIVSSALEE